MRERPGRDRRDLASSRAKGKTTVTVGLAVALASVGHDVVLLDATCAGPPCTPRSVCRSARRASPTGPAATAIRSCGAARSSNSATSPRAPPTGIRPTSTALALSRALIAYRQPGRLVLLDAPPIRGAAETPLVLDAASHVIVVVDASSSKMPELASMIDDFQARGIRFLGVVVNKAKKHRRDKNDEYAYLVPRDADAHERCHRQPGGARTRTAHREPAPKPSN